MVQVSGRPQTVDDQNNVGGILVCLADREHLYVERRRRRAPAAGASTRNAAIQGALKVLGYWDGPVDGQWSDALGNAIKKLQTDLGIPATGVVDTVTLQALEDKLAGAKSLAESSSTSTTSVTSTTSSTG